MKKLLLLLSNQKNYIVSIILAVSMSVVVLFIINPIIDGGNGFGIILLQLSFKKNAGIALISQWSEGYLSRYNQLMISDYFYAIIYGWCLSSIISTLIKSRGSIAEKYYYVITFPLLAAFLDWIENTLQWFFINQPHTFSEEFFTLHSFMACGKFLLLLWTFITIIRLLLKHSRTTVKAQ